MPNINKVVYGNTTIIDLTDSTLNTANQIANGVTAYDRSGTKLTGTLVVDSTYSVTRNLTDVSSSSDDTKVIQGNSFFTRLAPIPNNYVISSITVTMGGVDVTSQVFHPDEGGGGGADLGTKTITENGTYNASSDNLDGYSQVTVNVPTGTARTSSDLTANGATVTAPAGLYASAASKSVASMTLPTAVSSTSSGTKKATITQNTDGARYLNIPTGYNATAQYYELPSFPVGAKTLTANGTYNSWGLDELVGYSSVTVAVPIVTYYTGSSAPSSSLGSNGDIYLQTGS